VPDPSVNVDAIHRDTPNPDDPEKRSLSPGAQCAFIIFSVIFGWVAMRVLWGNA
jgi:hypothetical protein